MLLYIVIFILGGITGNILSNLFTGHYNVVSNEVVQKNTYSGAFRNWDYSTFSKGKITRIVNKVTYKSGRVKYITTEYTH